MLVWEPMERKFGCKVITITKNYCPFYKTTCDYVYDIRLLSSLEQLLSDNFILQEVTSYARASHNFSVFVHVSQTRMSELYAGIQEQQQNGFVSDYCDGSVYKSQTPSHTHLIAYLWIYLVTTMM